MAASKFGTSTANGIIDTMFGTAYLSLHTSDPGNTGANEVTGGSYARQLCAMDAASGGATANTAAESFTGLPDTTADDVSYVGFWSAASGGTFKCGFALTAGVSTSAGGTITIAAGGLTFSLPV